MADAAHGVAPADSNANAKGQVPRPRIMSRASFSRPSQSQQQTVPPRAASNPEAQPVAVTEPAQPGLQRQTSMTRTPASRPPAKVNVRAASSPTTHATDGAVHDVERVATPPPPAADQSAAGQRQPAPAVVSKTPPRAMTDSPDTFHSPPPSPSPPRAASPERTTQLLTAEPPPSTTSTASSMGHPPAHRPPPSPNRAPTTRPPPSPMASDTAAPSPHRAPASRPPPSPVASENGSTTHLPPPTARPTAAHNHVALPPPPPRPASNASDSSPPQHRPAETAAEPAAAQPPHRPSSPAPSGATERSSTTSVPPPAARPPPAAVEPSPALRPPPPGAGRPVSPVPSREGEVHADSATRSHGVDGAAAESQVPKARLPPPPPRPNSPPPPQEATHSRDAVPTTLLSARTSPPPSSAHTEEQPTPAAPAPTALPSMARTSPPPSSAHTEEQPTPAAPAPTTRPPPPLPAPNATANSHDTTASTAASTRDTSAPTTASSRPPPPPPAKRPLEAPSAVATMTDPQPQPARSVSPTLRSNSTQTDVSESPSLQQLRRENQERPSAVASTAAATPPRSEQAWSEAPSVVVQSKLSPASAQTPSRRIDYGVTATAQPLHDPRPRASQSPPRPELPRVNQANANGRIVITAPSPHGRGLSDDESPVRHLDPLLIEQPVAAGRQLSPRVPPPAPYLQSMASPMTASPMRMATTVWLRIDATEVAASSVSNSDVLVVMVRDGALGLPHHTDEVRDVGDILSVVPLTQLRQDYAAGLPAIVRAAWHVDEWTSRQQTNSTTLDTLATVEISIELRYGGFPRGPSVLVAKGSLPAHVVSSRESDGVRRVPVVSVDAYVQRGAASLVSLSPCCVVEWQRSHNQLPPPAVSYRLLGTTFADSPLSASPSSVRGGASPGRRSAFLQETDLPLSTSLTKRSLYGTNTTPGLVVGHYTQPNESASAIEARLAKVEAEAAALRRLLQSTNGTSSSSPNRRNEVYNSNSELRSSPRRWQ